MSWAALLELIEEEVGQEVAARIEERARLEFGGVRLTVSQRQVITYKRVEAAAPGRPKEAAKALGIHRATAYRIMHRARIVR